MKVTKSLEIKANSFREYFEKASDYIFKKQIMTIILVVCIAICSIPKLYIVFSEFDEFKALYKYSNEYCEYLKEQVPSVIVEGKSINFEQLTDKNIKYDINEETQEFYLYNSEGQVNVEYKYLKDGIIEIEKISYIPEILYKTIVSFILPAIVAVDAGIMSVICYIIMIMIMFIWSLVKMKKDAKITYEEYITDEADDICDEETTENNEYNIDIE